MNNKRIPKHLNYDDKIFLRKRVSSAVQLELRSKRIIRENDVAHHWSYHKTNRLNITWLSRGTHNAIHKLCRKLNWFWDI